ncbi:hypothetical protein ACPV3A_16890 [Paenibacillus sp. Dod16]|uniref:hypothetical protein n=1 Tax=Paenibacillus sp. Dod16 TaxID=3416392 RepID=UPI003CEE842E
MSMFSLKKPCADCPFRKDGAMLKSLAEGRMNEIVNHVVREDGFFPCHKTIDYNEHYEDQPFLQEQNKFCAGALIAIDKADSNDRNRNTRLALSWSLYRVEDLKDRDAVIDPADYLSL